MAHKNSADVQRKSKTNTTNNNGDFNKNNGNTCTSAENDKTNENSNHTNEDVVDEEEITGRFVGVDETDTAVKLNKIHILKTRSSSEQNLMLKTSSLRKGVKYLSSSLLYNGQDFGCVQTKATTTPSSNNNETNYVTKDNNILPKQIEINVTVSIDTVGDTTKLNDGIKTTIDVDSDSTDDSNNNNKECKELCELIKAVSNANLYKKNSNVYSVFQAKTLISERRRSIPMIPKLIGQKLHENNATKIYSKSLDENSIPSIHNTNNNSLHKDFRAKTFRTLSRGLGRLLRRHSSVNISEPDPVFKVAYLGNVLTGWAKGEGCVDKPLGTLWRNYNQSSKPDVVMKLSITNSGLKGITKEHGLTEYWAHRITYCCSPPEFPKVFCWVYRHEGRKLKHELRCHAVLCTKDSVAKKIASELQIKIKQALFEFKRDKICRQNARLSLANAVYDNPSLPRRKILLSVGGNNYKPPLERSKSAPKLMAIEEMCSEEDEEGEEPTKKSEISTNTWTKEMSTQKMCCKVEDYFPSYTLGRRKCDKRCLKRITFKTNDDTIPLLNDKKSEDIEKGVGKDNIDEFNNGQENTVNNSDSDNIESEERISSHSKSSNHVSFKLSSSSDASESDVIMGRKFSDPSTDTDDDIFYCETDDRSETKNDDSQNGDGGSQSNYMVLDSDEGSISSGCETASTVTSSDIEMTSLPCNFSQNDYNTKCEEVEEKVSVLERVQSFEQLFNRERNLSVRNFRSYSRRSFTVSNKFESMNSVDSDTINIDTISTNTDDSIPYSLSVESEPTSFGDEVNLIPLGETQMCRRTFLRCATYPSDDEANASSFDSHDFENNEGQDVCGNLEKGDFEREAKHEGEKAEEDSDSACSVESGYSELLENAQNDCVIGQTVMV